MSRRWVLLTVRCKRRGCELGFVVREGRRRYFEVKHAHPAKSNGFVGTPLREPIDPRVTREPIDPRVQVSGRLGCKDCGIVTGFVSHRELLLAVSRGDDTLRC